MNNKLTIFELIDEAKSLADPFNCIKNGHTWIAVGGRSCSNIEIHDCSQTVYKCKVCGDYDYGEVDGPGYQDCINCINFVDSE